MRNAVVAVMMSILLAGTVGLSHILVVKRNPRFEMAQTVELEGMRLTLPADWKHEPGRGTTRNALTADEYFVDAERPTRQLRLAVWDIASPNSIDQTLRQARRITAPDGQAQNDPWLEESNGLQIAWQTAEYVNPNNGDIIKFNIAVATYDQKRYWLFTLTDSGPDRNETWAQFRANDQVLERILQSCERIDSPEPEPLSESTEQDTGGG